MKVGSFLLGGMVGAAAVIYMSSKSKSMLLSALSSNNQSVGNGAGKTSSPTRSASAGTGGLGRVEEIINKEPKLKATVDEILKGNETKEQYQTQ